MVPRPLKVPSLLAQQDDARTSNNKGDDRDDKFKGRHVSLLSSDTAKYQAMFRFRPKLKCSAKSSKASLNSCVTQALARELGAIDPGQLAVEIRAPACDMHTPLCRTVLTRWLPTKTG